MRILVGIGHPAHVHFYRNAIDEWNRDGHHVAVISKPRKLALELLEEYQIEHEVVGSSRIQQTNPIVKGAGFARYELDTLRHVRRFSPDVVTGIANVPLSHASAIFDCDSIIFTDTEHGTVQNALSFPFADAIVTPDCYQNEIGDKQIRYPGYHELAYLHPNRFEPDQTVLESAGLEKDDKFVILRLVGWSAVHDYGDSGFNSTVDVVDSLEETGATVRITSEDSLPESIEDRKVSIPPHKIHDLMAYADLYIGESATMATESAVLGTPSVFVSSSTRGYTEELEQEFGLVFNFSGENRHNKGIQKSIEILQGEPEPTWEERRQRILENKIDTTNFLIEMLSKSATTDKVSAK